MKNDYEKFQPQIAAIFIIAMISSHLSDAQNPLLKIYGGGLNEEMHSMIHAHDDGFMMVGSTESFGQGEEGSTDAYIVKTDEYGIVQWSKTLGLQTIDDINWIEPTDDSAYVICGVTIDDNVDSRIIAAKINQDGEVLWQKVLAANYNESAHCIRQTTDGGFIIAAETISIFDDLDFLLIKTDGEGNVEWSKEIGDADSEIPAYILQTTDGGYLISGISRYGFYWMHMYTVKTDNEGNVEWEKAYNTFPYFSKCSVSKVIETSDGGYLIAGGSTRNEPLSDVILLKVNSSGTVQWTKAYGGSDAEYCGSIIEKNDGNYIVCGKSASSSNTGYYDALVMLIDSSGSLLKSSVFGQANTDDDFVSVVGLDDGGYMLGGNTTSFNQFEYSDFLIMRIDKAFNGPPCDTLTSNISETDISFEDSTDWYQLNVVMIDSNVTSVIDSGVIDSLICNVATAVVHPDRPEISEVSLYPNPTHSEFMINLKMETTGLTAVNIDVLNGEGQIIYATNEFLSGYELKKLISLSPSLAAGIYTVQISTCSKVYIEKLVVQAWR